MTWIVEQSENTSAVIVNGDTVSCTKDGYYDTPINVLYKDPTDKNGQYFWELECKDLDSEGGGSVSVGLTTDQHFKDGWGLTGMQYLGNLSNGGALLVPTFGDQIKTNDKVGLLLQLSDADLKLYIYHNDRPLGLAFHIKSPYPKPLYPNVSFHSICKVKISRSSQIPSSLNRESLQVTDVEGNWKIVDYSQHPECIASKFDIKRHYENQNMYDLHARVFIGIDRSLEHNPTTDQWKSSDCTSTMMGDPPEMMKKEDTIIKLIDSIQRLEVQSPQQLIIHTNNGEQVQLERLEAKPPPIVTENVFN